MRRIGPVLLLSLIAAAAIAELPGGRFRVIAAELGEIGPRPENSPQERAYFSYVRDYAAALGLETAFSDFSRSKEYHSFSRIAMVRVEGRRTDTLVIAVAANADGRAGQDIPTSIALLMMESLARDPGKAPPLSVEFLFLGAEAAPDIGGFQADYPLGSKLAISEFPESRPTAVFYLAMSRLGALATLDNTAPGTVSPYWIFKDAAECLGKAGFAVRHSGARNLFYRTSLIDKSCTASPFLLAGIPAVELGSDQNDSTDAEADPEEIVGNWLSFLELFLQRNERGFADSWDRHYLFLDGPRAPLVVTEASFVFLILGVVIAVCLVFMLSSVFARSNLIGIVSGFVKSAYSLPLCFALCLAVLFGASLLMGAAFALKGGQELWRTAPLAYGIARSVLVLSAFSGLFIMLLRFRLMPMTISFYGASSSLLFFSAIFVYSALDISFSMFFAWASAACMLSMLFRNRIVGVVSYLLILAPFALLVFSGGLAEGDALRRILIAPDFSQCLVLAVLVLPLILHFVRLFLLFHKAGQPPRRGFATVFGIFCLAAAGLAATFIFAYEPFGASRPLPLDLVEEGNGPGREGRLLVSAPARVTGAWIRTAEGSFELSGRPPILLPLASPSVDTYAVTAERRSFLNRKSLMIRFDAPEPVAWIGCVLESREEMRIYDASLPFVLSGDGKRARILIGANPEDPLVLELTVSKDFTARLDAVFASPGKGAAEASAGLEIRGRERRERRSVSLE